MKLGQPNIEAIRPDTPFDGGYGMEFNDFDPPLGPDQRWDPASAYEAEAQRRHDQETADNLRETIVRMPSLADKIVKIGDVLKEHRRGTVLEYITWLDEQIALRAAEVESAGGLLAAEAYHPPQEPGTAEQPAG